MHIKYPSCIFPISSGCIALAAGWRKLCIDTLMFWRLQFTAGSRMMELGGFLKTSLQENNFRPFFPLSWWKLFSCKLFFRESPSSIMLMCCMFWVLWCQIYTCAQQASRSNWPILVQHIGCSCWDDTCVFHMLSTSLTTFRRGPGTHCLRMHGNFLRNF